MSEFNVDAAGRDENADDLRFDPTNHGLMRTTSGVEIPPRDYCRFVCGTMHPKLSGLKTLTMERMRGSLTIPSTILLVNDNSEDPLSRTAVYGQDLIWQNDQRAMHTMVLGPTGTGKNTTVIDAMRYSAIKDPDHTAVSFSLKASDYGPMKVACKAYRKKMYVVNLNDAYRSVGWNPLQVVDLDEAVDVIRRFADASRNPESSDSWFWTQMIKTALSGAWQAGYRSFPAMFALFSLPLDELIKTLRGHNNPSSLHLATFLEGRSQNADSVLASIVGGMACMLSENVLRVMTNDELGLRKLFRRPVYLHFEISETRLETLMVLNQMFARAVIDELIDNAEKHPDTAIPATLFYDDLAALGKMLSPTRLMTMRSRGIGTVSGVQSLSSLELVYGAASRALIDNIHTKVILPGGVASDAEYFSQATGMQLVALPCYENQNPTFGNRPLLSGADIRTPNYSHPLLGMPATFIVGPVTFQAYLQRSYEHPEMSALLRAARGISGREKIRRKRLQLNSEMPARATDEASLRSISKTKDWTAEQVRTRLNAVLGILEYDKASSEARIWWQALGIENKNRMDLVLRLAEELAIRKATINEYYRAYRDCKIQNIQAALHFMDFQRFQPFNADSSSNPAPTQPYPLLLVATTGIEVILTNGGASKLRMCKVLKELCGMTISAALQMLEKLPASLGRAAKHPDALRAIKQIEDAGGSAKIA